jgi:HIRAN domain.
MPLFRRSRPQPVERPWIKVACGDGLPVEVRGESFHQPTLRALTNQAGPKIDDERLSATFVVALRREPENEYDANAVAVRSMSGEPLGHLARELAAGYSTALAVAERRYQVCCEAEAFEQPPWPRMLAGNNEEL